jgi:hypothetical protein
MTPHKPLLSASLRQLSSKPAYLPTIPFGLMALVANLWAWPMKRKNSRKERQPNSTDPLKKLSSRPDGSITRSVLRISTSQRTCRPGFQFASYLAGPSLKPEPLIQKRNLNDSNQIRHPDDAYPNTLHVSAKENAL